MLYRLSTGTNADIGIHRQAEREIIQHVDEAAILRFDTAAVARRILPIRRRSLGAANDVVERVCLDLGPQAVTKSPARADLPRDAGVEGVFYIFGVAENKAPA